MPAKSPPRYDAVAPARARVREARGAATTHPAGQAVVAGPLHDLAVALFDAGRIREAARPAQRAVVAWRAVLDDDPEYYSGELAGTLVCLARALWAAGRHAEALTATDEALARFRELVPVRPGEFRVKLVAALDEVALRFAASGRYAEALPYAVEAVATCRTAVRAGQEPERLLAVALRTLVTVLTGLDRLDDAVEAGREAVAGWRRTTPPARAELAQALLDLSELLASQGRFATAAELTDGAATQYRELLRMNRLLGRLPGLDAHPVLQEERCRLRAQVRAALRSRARYHAEPGGGPLDGVWPGIGPR